MAYPQSEVKLKCFKGTISEEFIKNSCLINLIMQISGLLSKFSVIILFDFIVLCFIKLLRIICLTELSKCLKSESRNLTLLKYAELGLEKLPD